MAGWLESLRRSVASPAKPYMNMLLAIAIPLFASLVAVVLAFLSWLSGVAETL